MYYYFCFDLYLNYYFYLYDYYIYAEMEGGEALNVYERNKWQRVKM